VALNIPDASGQKTPRYLCAAIYNRLLLPRLLSGYFTARRAALLGRRESSKVHVKNSVRKLLGNGRGRSPFRLAGSSRASSLLIISQTAGRKPFKGPAARDLKNGPRPPSRGSGVAEEIKTSPARLLPLPLFLSLSLSLASVIAYYARSFGRVFPQLARIFTRQI